MTGRRHRRLTVRVQVEYETELGTRNDLATTLGAGGLFLRTDKGLEPGTEMTTRFQLTPEGVRHELAARVVWRQLPGGPGTAGMGLEFSDPAATAALARELEAL